MAIPIRCQLSSHIGIYPQFIANNWKYIITIPHWYNPNDLFIVSPLSSQLLLLLLLLLSLLLYPTIIPMIYSSTIGTIFIPKYLLLFPIFLLVLSREWMGMGEWGNGIIINNYYGSFPHSLLSTSKYLLYSQGFIFPPPDSPRFFRLSVPDEPKHEKNSAGGMLSTSRMQGGPSVGEVCQWSRKLIAMEEKLRVYHGKWYKLVWNGMNMWTYPGKWWINMDS